VVRNDRRAVGPKLPDQFPHVAAKLDVDAGGGFVEEQYVWFMRERLGDHHRRFMPPDSSRIFRLALVPQRQALEDFLDLLVVRGLPNRPRRS
jgi:hypothetical protein